MARTVKHTVGEAQAAVSGMNPEEAQRRRQEDSNTLVIDVCDRERCEWSTAGRVRAPGGPALCRVRGLGLDARPLPSLLDQAL